MRYGIIIRMREFQNDLVRAWQDYAAGKIDDKTLKGFTAGFGIYQQCDLNAMMRIRRPGGIVTAADLTNAATIMEKYSIPFAHITTRQAIQLHGVRPSDVPSALEDCEKIGFRFRGGGGDTFRNTLVCRDSGLHADTAFDVLPYARVMSELFYEFDTAYKLPRKIKIGFADRIADVWLPKVQDLGFAAKIVDGKRVFETYFAGGIGFKPRVGIKLFDALPASECVRLAMALTRLFNDRGCRTNRAHARIRFLREDLGDEALVKLLLEYYENAKKDCPAVTDDMLKEEDIPTACFPVNAEPVDAGFNQWKALCVKPLAGGMHSIRVLVPFGNFTASEFRRFAEVMSSYGATRYQIINKLDFSIGPVPENQLAGFYNVLVNEFRDRDYTLRSFVGHISTCIGNVICRSGANDSPSFGKAFAEALDRYLPADTPEKLNLARAVLDEVRISGCPNSCTNPCAFKHGYVCRKTANGQELVPYSRCCIDAGELGSMVVTESKPVAEAAAALATEYLNNRKED